VRSNDYTNLTLGKTEMRSLQTVATSVMFFFSWMLLLISLIRYWSLIPSGSEYLMLGLALAFPFPWWNFARRRFEDAREVWFTYVLLTLAVSVIFDLLQKR
jgi:hypothetical protein